jgi:hypothetical protein
LVDANYSAGTSPDPAVSHFMCDTVMNWEAQACTVIAVAITPDPVPGIICGLAITAVWQYCHYTC